MHFVGIESAEEPHPDKVHFTEGIFRPPPYAPKKINGKIYVMMHLGSDFWDPTPILGPKKVVPGFSPD